MKEVHICEWIYRKKTNDTKRLYSLRIPDDITKNRKFEKGNYLIKIYKLKSEKV